MYKCPYCDGAYKQKRNMLRHKAHCKKREVKSEENLTLCCSYCDKTFARKDVYKRHVESRCPKREGTKRKSEDNETSPPVKMKRCDQCQMDVPNLNTHMKSIIHKNKTRTILNDYVRIINSAFKSRIATYQVLSPNMHLIPADFLEDVRERAITLIEHKLQDVASAVKVNVVLFGTYSQPHKDKEEEVTDLKSFNTKNKVIYNSQEISDVYDVFAEDIKAKADDFQERDSGWALKTIEYLEININKYTPLNGGSYIPLPDWIEKKHACINVQNNDEACFFWAVVSALYPAKKNVIRMTSYPHYTKVLNIENIHCPVTIDDISRFEEQNEISINVFEILENSIGGPIYHTRNKRNRHINLLLVENDEKSHFVWIKDKSRLIRSQLTKKTRKLWICDDCLLPFKDHIKYLDHIKQDCAHVVATIPDDKNKILKFKSYRNQLRTPVVVYADFEALLKPIESCSPNPNASYTQDSQIHTPYSYGYYIKCYFDDSRNKYFSYQGSDCVENFLSSLKENLVPFVDIFKNKVPMRPLTKKEEYEFKSCTNCHICGGELFLDRVRDHNHLTGKYRGAAHENCNLNFKINPTIPIFIHNLSKYDSHFIINVLKDQEISILAKNKENFISFTSRKHLIKDQRKYGIDLRFVDSYRFLSSSLEKLSNNLELGQLNVIREFFPAHVNLMRKKGIFPYEYVDVLEKLEETSLPPIEAFYSSLNKSGISGDDYEHARKVWSSFNIKTLGEYSDLYLKTDVLLLADVFENFREVCMQTYNLDPCNYFTAPGLSWDAALKHTKIELELFTDMSMIKFISKGIRGGMSQCCCKYAKANNKYMDDFDSSIESSFIVYLDANNQYGWAMSQNIPYKGFRWLTETEVDNFDLMSIPDNNSTQPSTGYILEVDLEYPEHLHNLHNELCYCPEKKVPEVNQSGTSKLLLTLNNKENYVIHYITLKQCLDNGLKCTKIHRILSFTQSPWLKSYIDMNTKKRALAKNPFEKDFYKLMNNAVFGKTMENVDKRVDVRLVNRWESVGRKQGARALISRLNFDSSTIINDDLVVIQMLRTSVKYDKPIYAGFTILEISKTLMYDFHYNYIKKIYNERATLLYTDTDSLIYKLETEDFYEDIKDELEERFDTSDFTEDNVYGLTQVNKKVVGKFKDEFSGQIIKEFIGIRSKCYYVRTDDEREIKKIKGIKKEVVKDEVLREDFITSVNEKDSVQYRTMNVIRSKAHQLYLQTLNKVTLRNKDDKRFIIPNDPHQTLAWGHKDIDNYKDLH